VPGVGVANGAKHGRKSNIHHNENKSNEIIQIKDKI